MAKKSTEDQYKAWTEEISGKLEGESKDAFTKLVSDDKVGKELFGGHLREADYYRRLNEHNAALKQFETDQRQFEQTAKEQADWWKQAKPEYDRAVQTAQSHAAELARSREQLKQYGLLEENDVKANNLAPSVPQSYQPSQEELLEYNNLKQRVAAMDQGLPKLLGSLSKIIRASIKDGYDVDPQEVIQYSIQNNVDPDTAFERMTAETRQERAAEDLKKQLEAARAEGRREAMSKQSAPDYIRPAMAGPSSSLFGKDNGAIHDSGKRKDAAVQAFLELESQS